MDQPSIISVQGLCNSFGEQVIHQDLNLEVRRGEILGVVGGSGTGKSVLMRSIRFENLSRAPMRGLQKKECWILRAPLASPEMSRTHRADIFGD